MILLAMDTSLGGCSVALWQGNSIFNTLHTEKNGEQSARSATPMIEELLTKAGIGYDDCDAIACTLGPGGFTGIRVALSGMASARLKP